MGENSKIEWCDHSFNPWIGCTKISAGCDHCYAEALLKRTGNPELWQGQRRRTSVDNWRLPHKWNRAATNAERPPRVFCASLADVFDNQVDPVWRQDLWTLIDECPALDWLLLTKRPENIRTMLPASWGSGWRNVWLGTTVEDQNAANRRIPILCSIPARKRFLSCEPLLGSVDLNALQIARTLEQGGLDISWQSCLTGTTFNPDTGMVDGLRKIHWVIAGGESGNGARPAHPEWFRALRDQCGAAAVPFFFKQWGEWREFDHGSVDREIEVGSQMAAATLAAAIHPGWVSRTGDFFRRTDDLPVDISCRLMERLGKHRTGAVLDGVEHKAFPA